MNKSLADNATPYFKGVKCNKEIVEPDTIAFSSKFYAKHHIPSYQERPGNNTINANIYNKYKPEYNLYCHKS